jgi:hypothetical protein
MNAEAITRRRLLFGSVGGAAVLLLERLRDPQPAAALDPNDVVLGASNVEASTTSISSPGNVDTLNLTAGGNASALTATASGLFEDAGIAIDASSASLAIHGRSGDDDGTGIHGEGGLLGVLGTGQTGVFGSSPGGIGVAASSATGVALDVHGPARFSSSGLATIRAGTRSRTVAPGLDITSRSRVLATLQTTAGGSTTVRRVARDVVRNRITIYLTGKAIANCQVAWFVIS